MQTSPTKKIWNPAKPFLTVALLLSLTLNACGYRGPLYLPDENPAEPAAEPSVQENSTDTTAAETDEEEEGPGSR